MATTVVMTGTDNADREDSDFEERNVKGRTTHQEGDFAGTSPVMSVNTVATAHTQTTNTTTTRTTTTGRNTTSFKLRSCGSGFCDCCACFWGTLFDCLDKIWTDYNRINMTLFFLIGLSFTLGMVVFFTSRYDYRLTNPSEFHYTTCIIQEIAQHKDDDDDWWNTITFVYSADNSDWSKTGTYKLKRKDWDKKNYEGDIGTCVYSVDPSWGDSFTIENYMIHSDTSAMWLILENKIGLISWIIFFVFSLFFCIIACLAWLATKCKFVEFVHAGVGGTGVFVLACMVVGWPVMIMGSVVMAGLNGPLSDGIVGEDVYDYMGDCIIKGVNMNRTYIPERENGLPFSMVQYNVFTTNGDLIAMDTYQNTTEPIFFSVDDVEICYMNRYSQQIILNESPNVEWLQLPTKRGTAIVAIVAGILLICAPCTIACLGACNSS